MPPEPQSNGANGMNGLPPMWRAALQFTKDFGVMAVIAVALIWLIAFGLRADVLATKIQLEAHAAQTNARLDLLEIKYTTIIEQLKTQIVVLRQVCVGVNKGDAERRECLR